MTGLSRAGFYRWRVPRQATPLEMELRDQMQKVALESPAYGYRRITFELQQRGFDVNHKRVLRMMREDNLLCVRQRAFVVTTDSRHNLPVYPNLAHEIRPTGINQLWVADITYIRLRTEFVYLAVVLDAFSRRVIGWALGRTLEAELAVTALRMALIERQPSPGLVHHSDRGVQYSSHDYTEMLKQHQATISMSRKGNPYDKAYVSYCTSCEPWTMFSGKRRRSASLTPCALRGGSGPGSSYRHMFLSFTGYALSKPVSPHARTHSGESCKRSAISSIVSKPFSRSRS
jgi:transposase InsO family protein